MRQKYWGAGLALAALLTGCGSSGDSGGSTADTQEPVFTSSGTVSVAENTTTVLSVSTDEAEVTFSLSGTDAALFELQGDVTLNFKTAPDYENPSDADGNNIYLLSVRATDAAGNSAEQNLSVAVTNVDEVAPEFTSQSAVSVEENMIAVLQVSTDDVEAVLSFGGTDAALFDLKNDGTLSFIAAPDHKNPLDADGNNIYLLTLTATDTTGNATQQELTVTVLDTTAPVFSSVNTATVQENTAAVLQVTTDDATATFTLSGADAALFDVQSDGTLSFNTAPDYENPLDADLNNIYLLSVTATDLSGNATPQDLSIEVTNIFDPSMRILKTGQTKSYDDNGTEVTDDSFLDDGYYQKQGFGEDRSSIRDNVNGIVTDNITGLKWQDNLNVTNTWASAGTYCSDLTLGGYTWRLPTQQELKSLVQYRRDSSALINPTFVNTAEAKYWSGTSQPKENPYSPDFAFYVDFSTGYGGSADQDVNYNTRCVSGDTAVRVADYMRSGSTVADNSTGLEWQDDSDALLTLITWNEAIAYCEASVLDGYGDWRLPNINELYSLVDHSTFNPAIDATFQNIATTFYWSSTTDDYTSPLDLTASTTTFVRGALYYYGTDSGKIKTSSLTSENKNNVRCVRGGQ